MTVLELRRVSKRVLREVNLVVRAGEVVTVGAVAVGALAQMTCGVTVALTVSRRRC